jgi:hypothetical protein
MRMGGTLTIVEVSRTVVVAVPLRVTMIMVVVMRMVMGMTVPMVAVMLVLSFDLGAIPGASANRTHITPPPGL